MGGRSDHGGARRISFIDHPSFYESDARREILEVRVPVAQSSSGAATGSTPFFSVVRSVGTFANEEQLQLFRLMNLLKSMACTKAVNLDARRPNRRILTEVNALLARAGQVRDRLAEANLRLVVSISRRLACRCYPFEEVLGDANLLLLRAIDRFDYSRGFRFVTYATQVIRRELVRQLLKRQHQLRIQEPVQAEWLRHEMDRRHTSEARLALRFKQDSLMSAIKRVLPERERKILTLRFGLEDPHVTLTRDAIGALLGISSERVRQLEKQAINRLRREECD
ncbi:MAG: sigma-70 family RNA polymerase sigma factor [Planctomycetes bacterium]|nr:sigma-70 family RNA polymerase sigma factor [Planctomycetota bacterium]